MRNKVTGGEYHHAPVTVVRTRDGQPSPPRKLSAIQQGDVLALAWLPPSDPKVGPIGAVAEIRWAILCIFVEIVAVLRRRHFFRRFQASEIRPHVSAPAPNTKICQFEL